MLGDARSTLTVGLALAVATTAQAQGRIVRPPPAGPIGVTLPSAPPAPQPRMDSWGSHRPLLPLVRDWSYAVAIDPRVTVPVPAPYPVPYYVPVPVARRAPPERPAPPPYDPTKARMLTIGGGADGGGGVMRINRLTSDSLRLTWLVPATPVREAKFFVADDARAPLTERVVSADRPTVVFGLGRLERPPHYVGLTVAYMDGSVRTTLVPLGRQEPGGR